MSGPVGEYIKLTSLMPPKEVYTFSEYQVAKERKVWQIATEALLCGAIVVNKYYNIDRSLDIILPLVATALLVPIGYNLYCLRRDQAEAAEGKGMLMQMRANWRSTIRSRTPEFATNLARQTSVPNIQALFSKGIYNFYEYEEAGSHYLQAELIDPAIEEKLSPETTFKLPKHTRMCVQQSLIVFPDRALAPRVERVYLGFFKRTAYLSEIRNVNGRFQAIWTKTCLEREIATDLRIQAFAGAVS